MTHVKTVDVLVIDAGKARVERIPATGDELLGQLQGLCGGFVEAIHLGLICPVCGGSGDCGAGIGCSGAGQIQVGIGWLAEEGKLAPHSQNVVATVIARRYGGIRRDDYIAGPLVLTGTDRPDGALSPPPAWLSAVVREEVKLNGRKVTR